MVTMEERVSFLEGKMDSVATKEDLGGVREQIAELRGEVRGQIADLRGDMSELKGEVKEQIAGLRGELGGLRGDVRGQIAELRGEFRGELKAIRVLMVTTISVTGLALAALGIILRLIG